MHSVADPSRAAACSGRARLRLLKQDVRLAKGLSASETSESLKDRLCDSTCVRCLEGSGPRDRRAVVVGAGRTAACRGLKPEFYGTQALDTAVVLESQHHECVQY